MLCDPIYMKSEDKANHRDRKYASDCLGLGVKMGGDYKNVQDSFWECWKCSKIVAMVHISAKLKNPVVKLYT